MFRFRCEECGKLFGNHTYGCTNASWHNVTTDEVLKFKDNDIKFIKTDKPISSPPVCENCGSFKDHGLGCKYKGEVTDTHDSKGPKNVEDYLGFNPYPNGYRFEESMEAVNQRLKFNPPYSRGFEKAREFTEIQEDVEEHTVKGPGINAIRASKGLPPYKEPTMDVTIKVTDISKDDLDSILEVLTQSKESWTIENNRKAL